MSYLSMKASSKKSKKKDKSSGPIEVQAPQTSQPSRVTNKINIPVRQQIAWAKAYKRLMSSTSSSTPVNRTRFRQSRGPKDTEEYDQQYEGMDYDSIKPPTIFVDGYNIIGYMNQVKDSDAPIDLEDARDCLISDLNVLQAATGWLIEVIFDAYKNGGSEVSKVVDNVSVTFTSASETADNHIERKCEQLRKEGFTNIIVATDDVMLRMTASSAGAGYLPASTLVEEFRIAYEGWEILKRELIQKTKTNRPTLADGLSLELKEAIEKMKN